MSVLTACDRRQTCRAAIRVYLVGEDEPRHTIDIRHAINAYRVEDFGFEEVAAALSYLVSNGFAATARKPFGCITYYRAAYVAPQLA